MVMKQLACIGGLYERMTICKCDMGDDRLCRHTRDNNVTLFCTTHHDREIRLTQPVFASEPAEMHTTGVIPANSTIWFSS